MRLRNDWKGIVVLSLVGLFAGSLLAEAACRVFGLSKTWAMRQAGRLGPMTNDSPGRRYKPGAAWIGAYGAHYSTNQLGYRGREIPTAQPGATRIAILGDSVAEGLGVELQDRFSERLESLLGSTYQVLNFAVSGYSTRDEIVAWQRDAERTGPSLVILQFCYNDVLENGATGPSGRSLASNRLAEEVYGPKIWLSQHSALYLFIAERVGAIRLARGVPSPQLLRIQRLTEEQLTTTGLALRQLVSALAPTPLLVVYVPQESEVRVGDEGLATAFAERLRPMVEEGGAAFLSTVRDLRSTRCPVFLDDCHLTPCGHRVVSESLANWVRANATLRTERGHRGPSDGEITR